MQTQPQDAPWASFDSGTDEDQGLDMWGFFQRRKAFIILLAIVGAGLGYLLFERQEKLYSSSALLQVIHHNSDPMLESRLAERNLSDAQFVITGELLLSPCYDKHDLGRLQTLRGIPKDAAIRKIRNMISASPEASNILFLTCKGTNPEDTKEISNAVAKEYIIHQQESYEDAVSKLEQLFSQAKDELSENLDKMEDDYAAFEAQSQLGSDGENPHRKNLSGIQQEIAALVIEEAVLRSEFKSLDEARRDGGTKEALLLLLDKYSENTVASQTPENAEDVEYAEDRSSNAKNMFQTMFPLLMEEAALAEKFGSGHPELVALRKRIEMTRDHLDAIAGMSPKPVPKDKEPPKPRPDFLTVYMNSLQHELQMKRATMQELQSLADQEERAAKELRNDELTRAKWEARIARESSLLGDVQQQIRDTQLPTNMGGVTANILTEAAYGELFYPKMPQFLGMGAFLGAFVGLLLGYIVEVADRSFRKPEEIVREFGIPILGHVPYMQEQKLRKIPKDTVMDRSLICLHLPRSRPSEAYRSVRTAVCFSALGNAHRVIQVTSPAAGDGKSTLAMNFAVSLAQSGKKTLIMESDFRRPKVHKLTGVDNKKGVVDVLRGKAEISDAIKETELEGFYVMPCGSRPKNPSELLSRPEYEHLLSVLREKFDYVIVDTPPVLVVTDPCSVAPRVDGVVLCVRLSRHTREFGRRALEQLRDVGASMSGIVINGVEETDAYGYGNYSYSDYRYRYKDYSYNYGYGDKQNEGYFAEADPEEEAAAEAEEVST